MLIEIELRQPLDEIDTRTSQWGQSPIVIRVDNSGAMDLSANTKHHDRTKHIDIKHHFIRRTIAKGLIRLVRVPSAEQTADILTKPLGQPKFEEHRRSMGVGDIRMSRT